MQQDSTSKNIIGYIHICQIGQWQRSLKMILDAVKKSGLYENTQVIRLGILNDLAQVIPDEILNDEKFEIIHVGVCAEYEGSTLRHMRQKSEEDDKDTLYYYLHTKGISYFGKNYKEHGNEEYIVDWINLLLYWNVEKWKLAVEKLETYDTYGCNDVGWHYSGNYWWAKSSHIMKLPTNFEMKHYTDLENWVQTIRDNKFCVYNSGLQGNGHYTNPFPRSMYCQEN